MFYFNFKREFLLQTNKMDRRCSRKLMLEAQENGEEKLVFYQLLPTDIFRNKMLVQLNSKFQKYLLYLYLVRILCKVYVQKVQFFLEN